MIATSKEAESAPTTGRIASIGPLVPEGKRKLQDRVMFRSYSGDRYDVTARTVEGGEYPVQFRILRDDEVIVKLYGELKLRQVKKAMALYTAS